MSNSILKTRIQNKIDQLSNWEASDIILLNGEFGIVLSGDVFRGIKIGNGIAKFSELPYYISSQTQLDAFNKTIINVAYPELSSDAANKIYVDDNLRTGLSSKVNLSGDVMTGGLTVPNLTIGDRKSGSTIGAASMANGASVVASGFGSHAEGSIVSALGTFSYAGGFHAIAKHTHSFVWQGDNSGWEREYYNSHGDGTFNINPLPPSGTTDPAAGFYIGEQSLKERLDAASEKSLISTTWLELKNLRDNSNLVPGRQYRITDYVATTNGDMESHSANHSFDIIVVADDEHTLNEHARAIKHDGDTYFTDCKLYAWNVWYCLDNDTTHFAWADTSIDESTENPNGRGIIYRLIDEFQNDVPYDFKGIQFKAYGDTDDVWRYTFDSGDASDNTDSSLDGLVYKNTIAPYSKFMSGSLRWRLNRMVFKESGCCSNTFDVDCHSNTFCVDCYSNTFGVGCHSNMFGWNCWSNTFGADCLSNTFGDNCHSNAFGVGCHSNTLDLDCYSNTFGAGCLSNTLGEGCYSNTFGMECKSNTLGVGCHSNAFGTECYSNTFGSKCAYNQFHDRSYECSLGTSCGHNELHGYNRSIILRNYCSYNTFGIYSQFCRMKDYCQYNEIQAGCNYVNFGESYNSLRNYYQNIIVETGVNYVCLNALSATGSSTKKYRYVTLRSGISGDGSKVPAVYKVINDDRINQTYNTTYQPANSQVIMIDNDDGPSYREDQSGNVVTEGELNINGTFTDDSATLNENGTITVKT